VKPDVKSVAVHSQLCRNGHPVDGVLVGTSLLWVFTEFSLGVTFHHLVTKKPKGVRVWIA